MCYSARVRQNLTHLSRRYEAEVDWAAFEDLYRRRAEGEDIKASRDLQRNFQNPENDIEHRTAAHIANYLKTKRSEWEAEVFAQKRRVAEAEESLAKRDTKKAREDIRIWSKKAQEYLDRLADLRRTVPNNEDARIFPMMYAPVLIAENSQRIVRPMRYACRLAGKPADYDRRFPGTYNARRDSLDDYWNEVYGRHHAAMVISGFYENVPSTSPSTASWRLTRSPRVLCWSLIHNHHATCSWHAFGTDGVLAADRTWIPSLPSRMSLPLKWQPPATSARSSLLMNSFFRNGFLPPVSAGSAWKRSCLPEKVRITFIKLRRKHVRDNSHGIRRPNAYQQKAAGDD